MITYSAINSEPPSSWAVTTLGELKEFSLYGPRFSSKDYSDNGVCVLRTTDISESGKVNITKAPKLPLSDGNFEKYRCKIGDLLITRTGSLGTLAVFNDKIRAIPGAYLIQYRLQAPEITSWYVFYYLKSAEGQRYLTRGGKGIGRSNLNAPTIDSIRIPLAPLPEQRRIVARIEELFSRLDAGVAALRQAKAQLQRYRQSVLTAAVTGQLTQKWREENPEVEPGENLLERILKDQQEQWPGHRKYRCPRPSTSEKLPELPATWTYISPDQLSASEDHSLAIGPFGSNLKVSDYTETGIPLVFVRNIRTSNYDLDPKFIDVNKATELEAHSIDPGDLLITKMGDPPGNAALYPNHRPRAIITADCIKLRTTPIITAKSFFISVINSKFISNQIASRTRGVAQKKISLDRFRDIALPLPPLAEQSKIVAKIEARTSAIDRIEAEIDKEITRCNQLRQSILASTFTGNHHP